jgi:hypothetical protein
MATNIAATSNSKQQADQSHIIDCVARLAEFDRPATEPINRRAAARATGRGACDLPLMSESYDTTRPVISRVSVSLIMCTADVLEHLNKT